MLDHAQAQLGQPAPAGYAWARANSFSLLQILVAAEQHEKLRDKAKQVRKTYLDVLPENLIQFEKDNTDLMDAPELSYFPLLAREKEVCILMTDDDLKKAMRAPGEPGEEFGHVFVAADWSRKPDKVEQTARSEYYPLFNQAHLAQFPVLHSRSISRLSIHSLETIARSLLPQAYVQAYMLGAASGAKEDWTTPRIQAELKGFVLPLVGHAHDDYVSYDNFSEARFSEDLLKRLFAEAEAVHGSMNDAEKAFFLRSHAASLSYASSSRMFGRELDSPEGLRVLAVAMLNHADELDPGVEGFSKDNLADYRGRLLGKGNAFTCTAILSGMLQGKLKDQMKNDKRFETIYYAALPARWSTT
ncbi:hypothetical protein [Paraburkholderia sp. RL17-373-BIF-A]|uniref:hypothetical protein n=1 Tax=Paraburkholderia sp. RL17-373-BIF-A TaxID=3031629 RepID=UPI0038BAB3E1